jgi:hypothetical protein
MHEQFTPIWFHQGLESRPIAHLSGEYQCDLGWSLHRGISSSRLILPDPVMFTRKLGSDAALFGCAFPLE